MSYYTYLPVRTLPVAVYYLCGDRIVAGSLTKESASVEPPPLAATRIFLTELRVGHEDGVAAEPTRRGSFIPNYSSRIAIRMIRFACDTCGRSLRAPETLAGKRGKCARCGAVNRVPAALSVDVKRAVDPTPFRSTADLAVRHAIEGSVDFPERRFSDASPVVATVTSVDPRDFFDQVASRMAEGERPFSADEQYDRPSPAVPPARGERFNEARRLQQIPDNGAYVRTVNGPPHDLTRAVVAALGVGAVIGFCAGLLASKWVL
jgi:hypothetical protein